MNATEIILISIQILFVILIFFIGLQILKRLDHILEKLTKYIEPEDAREESVADQMDYGRPAISRELMQQKEILEKDSSPEAQERIKSIERFLKPGWLQFADPVGLTFLESTEELQLPIEKILYSVFKIQFPQMDPRNMGIEHIRSMKIFIDRTLTAFIELGYIKKTNENYQVTEVGQQLFENALRERIEFEEKFLSLYPNRQELVSGCRDNRCVFIIQKDTDDASEVSGGSTCTFSTDDENIYLGECYHGEAITAGFRFVDIDIPSGATIEKAYLEFVADGPYINSISLSIHAEDGGNAKTFNETDQPSNRPMTTFSALWRLTSNETWQLGQIDTTPDISNIIQAVINRSDWQTGNALAVLIKGIPSGDQSGHRRLVGFHRARMGQEYDPPRLVVQFRL